MYCPNCGSNMNDGIRFCTQCGTKLNVDQPNVVADAPKKIESTPGKMTKIQCELCGSTDIMKEEGFFVCQHCGCKYSLEEARKMMIEGKVEINNEKEIRSKIELAKEAVIKTSFSDAMKLADQALSLDSSIADGWLIKASCVKYNTNKGDLENYLKKADENKSNSLGIFTKKDYDNLSVSYIKVKWVGNMGNGMGLNITLDAKEQQSCPAGRAVTFVCKKGSHTIGIEVMNTAAGMTTVEVGENETAYIEIKWGFSGYKMQKVKGF